MKARVKKLALDLDMPKGSPSKSKEDRILERIKKCLDRSRHPTTPEAEARTSLSMAAKLMAEYNIKEAALNVDGDSESTNTKPGESIVEGTKVKPDGKKTLKEFFTGFLAVAMGIFFDCKSCARHRGDHWDYVFYGLSRNTATAAMSFEMCYNLIQHWSHRKMGRSSKNSYRVGVATGLQELSWKEKQTRDLGIGHQVTLNYQRLAE